LESAPLKWLGTEFFIAVLESTPLKWLGTEFFIAVLESTPLKWLGTEFFIAVLQPTPLKRLRIALRTKSFFHSRHVFCYHLSFINSRLFFVSINSLMIFLFALPGLDGNAYFSNPPLIPPLEKGESACPLTSCLWRDLRLSLFPGGEGTNTSPINMSPIRITIKVVAFLVSVERAVNGFILNGFTVKGANGLGGYVGRKF
jgi:hypothetical protein